MTKDIEDGEVLIERAEGRWKMTRDTGKLYQCKDNTCRLSAQISK